MKKQKRTFSALPVFIVIAVFLFVLILILDKPETPAAETPEAVTTEPTVETTEDPYAYAHTPLDRLVVYARLNDKSLDEWPDYMIELIEKNPDAEEYVRNYPELKGTLQEIDLSDLVGTGEVPKLYQWDARWGYSIYGSKEMGLTACGPTCLSMACLYFLEDAKYTPRYVATFAEENGYYTPGYGSAWTLISEGAKKLGLNVKSISPNMSQVRKYLEEGHLVVFCMGPGDFTTTGHFILLTGVKDGKAVIHDPNSPTNTEKLWDLEAIQDQIRNLWLIKKP